MKIVVIGGGWAGCAAAVAAAKQGLEVTLLERTDALLGTADELLADVASRIYACTRYNAPEEHES